MELDITLSSKAKEDLKLVEAALIGEEKAFRKLMNKYRKSVYFMVLKMIRDASDAEDVTQESFTKAFANLEKFDQKYAFSTWLFRIATNICIDFIRKKKLDTQSIHSQGNDEDSYEIQLKDSSVLDPDATLMKSQRSEYVHIAVNKLAEKFRILIELRYYDELTYEEISEKLEIPLGTVKAQLHRAKELLIETLSSIEEDI